MSRFKFLQYERTGDLIRIAINPPPFKVIDIASMQEMNVALDHALEEPLVNLNKSVPVIHAAVGRRESGGGIQQLTGITGSPLARG